MGALQYLFGFKGRINRAKVWLYLLIAIGLGCVMGIVAVIGFDVTPTIQSIIDQVHANPGDLDWSKVVHPVMRGPVSYVAVVILIALYVVGLWINLAVYAKRLHDRNRTAWWLLAYVGLPGLLDTYDTVGGTGAIGGDLANGLSLLITLWVFIDLWCLRGSKGSNQYGVDPLEKGPVYCDPGKPVYGCVPKA